MLGLWVLATVLTTTGSAPGVGEPDYEDRLIQWGLDQHHLVREYEPEGKPIERVEIASENVFSPSDPWPNLLNIFHWQTHEGVIRREVLSGPGDLWKKETVEETERNLRRLVILGVAKVVAAKGDHGGVVLLVVTKDRWSLRLEWDYLLVGSLLEYLHVPLTEVNFLGQGQQVTLDPLLRLDTLQLGESFSEPRLFGTRLAFNESAAIVLNRQTGKPEGTSGTVELSRPLYTLDQEWSFDAFTTWDVRRSRYFRGANIWQLNYPNDTAPLSTVPYVFDSRVIEADALVTRSFGRTWKLDATAGVGGYTHLYQPPTESMLTPEVSQWFVQNWLPRSEDATYLYGLLVFFKADYRVLKNIDAFALSEDFQVGPLARAGFKWAIPTPLAKSNFGELGGSLRYRALVGDDLFTATGAAAVRFVPDGPPVNEHFAFEISNFSPMFEGGRLVVRLLGEFWVRDLNNHQILLGGGNGLSGAPPEVLAGHNELLANVEFRTRPFEIATVNVGLVLFYDAGSAYDTKASFTHTTGLGLRILLPQLNRDVIRIDFGFVIAQGDVLDANRFSSSFGQVTQLHPAFLDDPI